MRSRRSQVAAMRRVAVAALDDYALPAGALAFVSHGENTTFRWRTAGGSFLVRVHRPDRHGRGVDSAAAVSSELAWLSAIRADGRVAVPEPVPARDGSATVTATAGGETRVCSVLRWMDGRLYETTVRPVHLRRLGEAMARLHDQADAWTPPPGFTRIEWDAEAFFGDTMVYGTLPAAACWDRLPARLRKRFDAVAARLAARMDGSDRGLIHADLHPGNALFHGDDVRLIDFDDCGTGPRRYELAVALWELRDRPDYPAYRDALLAGYRAYRPFDDEAQLDEFIGLRQVAFALWFVGTAEVNPDFRDELPEVLDYSAELLDRLGFTR